MNRTEEKIEEVLESVKESYCLPLTGLIENYTNSPIETLFLLHLLNYLDPFVIDSRKDGDGYIDYISSSQGSHGGVWHIEPQFEIQKYLIVDFVILFPQYSKLKIVIECDGHDFHEKTKEQVKKDKQRDRTLTKLGFKILRFSGSEIYNNPKNCVMEIEELVLASMAGKA